MSHTLTLKQITDKITHLEEEMNVLRKELDELRQQKANIPTKADSQVIYAWADKQAQRRWVDQLFASLAITSRPLGSQTLQQKMSQVGLSHNELSRGIVEAREE